MKFEKNKEHFKINKQESWKISINHRYDLPDNFPDEYVNLGWPMEIQGYGSLDFETGDFHIHYPVGETFISLSVIIHEIGHIGQEALNKELLNLIDENKRQIAKEEDAAQRGWERLQRYAPNFFNEIQKDFNQQRDQGRMKDFESIQELYTFINQDINIPINIIFNQEKDINQRVALLKEHNVNQKFNILNTNKTNEIINTDFADELIEVVLKGCYDELSAADEN